MPLAGSNAFQPNPGWLSRRDSRPKNKEQAPSESSGTCTIPEPFLQESFSGWLQPEDAPWSPPTYVYLETRGNSADFILQSPILRRPSTQEPHRFDPPYVHRPINLRLLANQTSNNTRRGRRATVFANDGSTFSPGWKEIRRCVIGSKLRLILTSSLAAFVHG